MNFWKLVIIAVLLVLLGTGVYSLEKENSKLENEIKALSASLQEISSENKDLESAILYYNHPENLLKELKAHFNYKEEGEKLIIIVPQNGN